MRTAAVAFILSMLCGTILTPLVRRLAHHYGALDHALSSRKIHGQPVPRLGGIAIVLAFYTPLVGLLIFQTSTGEIFLAEREHVVGLFAGGGLIALLGIYDDLRGAGATRKFLVQVLVAGLMYALGFRMEVLANPFGPELTLGWFALPFTLLWFVGVINAMNLIDGLDGLAGGVALVAVVTTFLIALERAHPIMMLFSSTLAGAILGFLFYNFNPATIFMGDTGSMFLGFVLAASAIQTNQKSSTAVAVLIPAIALGLPIMDTLLAMSRRAWRGQPLFQADKDHIHHRLLALGLSQRQAVFVLYGFCVVLGATALLLTYANSVQTAFLLVAVGLVVFIFLRSLGFMRLDRMAGATADRRRNKALRALVRPLGRRLRDARASEDIWTIVSEAVTIFGAVGVRVGLNVEGLAENTPTAFVRVPPVAEPTAPELFRAPFVIPGGKERVLELAWRDGRREIDRDTEIAIDIFCEHLGEAFDVLKTRGDEVGAAHGQRTSG
ncbi:MAG: glycosyl transferase family 4 [Myxococcales bacterium]|nr:glycosyl transferase family 4 [Myxococcales bacterium]